MRQAGAQTQSWVWVWAAVLACACDGGGSASKPDASGDTKAEVSAAKPVTSRLFVLDTIKFTRQNPPGVAPGWNLDGKVSDGDDASTCGKKDFTSPEGVPGVDNQFSILVPLIEKTGISAFETLLQASVESGGVLLMVQVEGADNWSDDPEITVHLRAGQGVPLLGTDGKVLAGQTFHVNKRDTHTLVGKAALKGGVADLGPFDMDMPLQIFGKDYTLEMRGGRLRFQVIDGDRLEAGLVGGGITMASIAKIAKTAAEDQGNIDDIVQALTGGMGDLAKDATGTCQQLSAVLSFSGVAAYFYPADLTATSN